MWRNHISIVKQRQFTEKISALKYRSKAYNDYFFPVTCQRNFASQVLIIWNARRKNDQFKCQELAALEIVRAEERRRGTFAAWNPFVVAKIFDFFSQWENDHFLRVIICWSARLGTVRKLLLLYGSLYMADALQLYTHSHGAIAPTLSDTLAQEMRLIIVGASTFAPQLIKSLQLGSYCLNTPRDINSSGLYESNDVKHLVIIRIRSISRAVNYKISSLIWCLICTKWSLFMTL